VGAVIEHHAVVLDGGPRYVAEQPGRGGFEVGDQQLHFIAHGRLNLAVIRDVDG